MEKEVMAIRIAPQTREKLDKLKDRSGLAYGVIIDDLVADAPIPTVNDYDNMTWEELVDEIAVEKTKPDQFNRQLILSVLITIGNEHDCLEEVQDIIAKLIKDCGEDQDFIHVMNWIDTTKEFGYGEK